MGVCVYVCCVFVCVCVCVCLHVFACVCACLYARVYGCVCMLASVFFYRRLWVYVCIKLSLIFTKFQTFLNLVDDAECQNFVFSRFKISFPDFQIELLEGHLYNDYFLTSDYLYQH